jgi:hypothetical protein
MRSSARFGKFCTTLFCFVIVQTCVARAAESNVPRQMTVSPELSDTVLINPGMGWQFIGYIPPKDEAEKMPLISTFYTRYGWKDFETAPGKYGDTWVTKMIDQWLEYCKKHNRYFGFRVVTYDSSSKEGCVPDYVFQQGAKRFLQPDNSGGWVPIFWDKIYLDRHEKLVEWMSQRWGKHPNLAYIDIPGGNWGEWNMQATGVAKLDDGSAWKANGMAPDVWDPMVLRMVDMYTKGFPNRLIVASGGMVEYGKPTTPDWAVGRGIGFRDDGLGMSYCTAGRKNPYFEKYWKKVPCFYENGYSDWTSFGDRSKVEPCINWAINQTHATIIAVGKNDGCQKSYTLYKDLLVSLGKKLGYRFEIKEASYYSVAHKGQNFEIGLSINNSGNVPVYFDCKLEVSFVNDAGQVLGQEYAEVVPPIRQWMPGATDAKAMLKVPGNLPTGAGRLCIGMVNASVAEQRIELPLKNTAGERRYVLGPITVQGGSVQAPVSSATATGTATGEAPAASKVAIDAKTLEPWNARLLERVTQGIKDGQHVSAYLKVMGAKDDHVKVLTADAKGLTVDMEGNSLPLDWGKLDSHDRMNLAMSFMKEDSAADHLLVAVFSQASERKDAAADHLAKAQVCSPKPDADLLAAAKAVVGQ